MGKTKPSTKRKGSSKSTPSKVSRHPESPYKIRPGMGVVEIDPNKELLDRDHIARALFECLEAGDHEGYVEVITIYLNAVRREQAAMEHNTPRIAFSRNPTVRTIAQHVHASL